MRYPALALLLLAACSEGTVLFDGHVPDTETGRHARLVRLMDGRLVTRVWVIDESGSPPDWRRAVIQSLAEGVVERECTNGSDRLSVVPASRRLGGTNVEFSERSLWRCRPEEIRAARETVLTPPHPCGIHPDDFVPGRISRC
jgi:hypothetical protein